MRFLTPFWPDQRAGSTDLFREMEKIFNGWQEISRKNSNADSVWSFPYEIAENDDQYVVSAELPGIKKENIKIEMNGDVLTVTGEKKTGNGAVSLKRSFSVPSNVNHEKIEAKHEDGVLSILLPKAPLAKVRTIEITTPSH